jgi:GT2 family glycosyltransferase
VVVTTRNRPGNLRRCIASIQPGLDKVGATLVVVDNGSADPEALATLTELRAAGATVVHAEGAWNTSHLANVGVAATNADTVCLIEDDVTAFGDGWLGELLGRMAEPAVAAVGPLMLHPGGVVAHMGMVAGPAFSVAPALADRMLGDPGYADLLRIAHQQSALAPGCILVRRAEYQTAGGMDAIRFPDALGIVDLCLKLSAGGGRLVVTPHAQMQTTKRWHPAPAREVDLLRAIWADTLAADPFYSAHLCRDGVAFSALAWPPREQAPRSRMLPRPRDVPSGF